jgi:hypothetical protein
VLEFLQSNFGISADGHVLDNIDWSPPFTYKFVDVTRPCVDWTEGTKIALKGADVVIVSFVLSGRFSEEGAASFFHQLRGMGKPGAIFIIYDSPKWMKVFIGKIEKSLPGKFGEDHFYVYDISKARKGDIALLHC